MAVMTKRKIEELVKSLLEETNISKPPVPVEKVARHLGAVIRFSPLDEELSGMIFVKEDKSIIGVNALHHPNRQRFTIAHELGHLFLHKKEITNEVHVDKQFPVLMRDAKSAAGIDNIEIEANAFAALLLMPTEFVKNSLEDSSFDIDDDEFIENLAKKFKVSTQAIQLRLGQIING